MKRAISLLKDENFQIEKFKKQVEDNYLQLKNVKVVRLNSEYLTKLLEYTNLILYCIDNYTGNFEEQKELLLKEANLLHKEKNKSNYKKDKHKSKKFNDGYY